MGILESIKSVLIILAFLLIATGIFMVIRFEIHYGVAGGKLGGADIHTMPGTFWFFIWLQSFWVLHLITDAIKRVWILLHGSAEKRDEDNPAGIIAIYWVLATFGFLILNLLAVWSSFEMLFNVYNLLDDLEMPDKAVMGVLYLLCFATFYYICYMFLLRTLLDTIYPKARISVQILRKNNK